jgi:RibD C-terminal domain
MVADEELHRHAVENLAQAGALLSWPGDLRNDVGSVAGPARTGARPDWMEPFARTIDAAKKYVVSSTLDRVDWNAELVRGDLEKTVQQLKRESGKGLFVAGVKLPLALTELGLIDEFEFVVQPRLAGQRRTFEPNLDRCAPDRDAGGHSFEGCCRTASSRVQRTSGGGRAVRPSVAG